MVYRQQNVTKIIQAGSTKDHLQKVAINECLKNDIGLLPVWIPKEQNVFSDSFSKEIDKD